MYTKIKACVVAGALVLSASAGHAAVLTFNFDDANNGDKSYSKYGYTFDPTNFDSSNHCYNVTDDKHCFHEVKNGDPTHLTETATPDAPFDLLSFYFNFQGEEKGGSAPDPLNSLYLYSNGGQQPADPVTQIDLNASYDGTGDFQIFLASDLSPYFGPIEKQEGYFVLFNNDLFDDITKFTFEAVESKQVRIDCVSISPDGMDMSKGDLGNCRTTLNEVPLPASVLLLFGGLGTLGAFGLRRRG